MKRYQVITYCSECGADEKLDYATKSEAEKVARNFRIAENYEGALVYDLRAKKTISLHGWFPLSAMPVEA